LILAGVPTVPAAGQAGAVHDRWAGHDPRPTLSAVTVPVLALFGEHDPLVPHRSAVRGLREALGGSGHVDHEVAVVRGADHGLRVLAPHGLGGMVHGFHRFGDWPPALSRLVVEWLERRLLPDEVPTYAPPQHAPALRLPTPARSRSGSALPPSVPVRQLRRRVPR
jgi:pimeloyl-ACP methyl ester carboxylesterase